QTRYEIACQLLRDTRLATQDVASALGYADVTAFARAFRCWSETTPAAWRSAHQPD
ncbi:MAG: AraC family transcriptional regulator, partial [Gammaproteobacteria bacterium]|nr:AraC family transcriptional regulator [Gammaproteobacteria bacterium]